MSETGKIEREDGSTVWIANDGREYKSKSGMWKRNKKLKSEGAGPTDEATKEAGQPEVETRKSSDRKPVRSKKKFDQEE